LPLPEQPHLLFVDPSRRAPTSPEQPPLYLATSSCLLVYPSRRTPTSPEAEQLCLHLALASCSLLVDPSHRTPSSMQRTMFSDCDCNRIFLTDVEYAGADVNVSRYFHPLAKAAEKGLTEAIKCLVEAGADANVPDTDDDIVKKTKSDLKRSRSLCWLRLGDGEKVLDDAVNS
ncbi:hypothetical protein EJB05_34866, partial [Eragrostis curvula]